VGSGSEATYYRGRGQRRHAGEAKLIPRLSSLDTAGCLSLSRSLSTLVRCACGGLTDHTVK
jgi:hypothetical protein